jgi:hypothetical protein
MIEVFRVKIYDVQSDQHLVSKRLATKKGIETMRGVAHGPPIAIPESDLQAGEQWTHIDYEPPAPATRPAVPERPRLPQAAPLEAFAGTVARRDPGKD